MKEIFKSVTPEQAGISSEHISNFINTLNSYSINTHSIVMARGNNIITQCGYAPFDIDTPHRMYSVSKSFVAIAIGLAEQEGLLSLDDCFLKYFPEYINENTDEKYRRTTIRDMLTMRSCMAKYSPWWGSDDRVKAYFAVSSNQEPCTNFNYDSAGSFLLGCIVEKVTGMPFLEYLKQKILLEIGFSKDAYCLLAPGGHSHSDSGVICSARDLLIFARFVMNGGVWNGKRYINEDFMRAAISKQTDNDISGITTPLYNRNGYGYLIWKMPRDGFGFIGMADQLAICDPETDFIFIMTGENMDSEEITKTIILHELYKTVIENIGQPLPENNVAYKELKRLTESQKMLYLKNSNKKNISSAVSGKRYLLEENPMDIKSVAVTFNGNCGVFEFEDSQGEKAIEFGIEHNRFGKFPDKKRLGLTASVYEEGQYNYAASAVWCEECKLHILVRIIDTYMGTLSIVLGFKGEHLTITMQKHAQRILDKYNGTSSSASTGNPPVCHG